ncbi:hypothetical protein JIN77_05510 [Verrucomicrobiaceae bacterium R5-34]|nr:hypothetical protein [Verrucomicrobiaceae bacterium R5-34]
MPIESMPAARQVVTRKQEEEWAAKHSRITRILGWCLIVGFVFTLVSAFFTDHLHIDILMLAGGCAILNGSQAWLRFYLFVSCMIWSSQLIQTLVTFLRGEPLELDNAWVDYHDQIFWLELVLPIGVCLGFSLLCFMSLRSRQLVFWTATSKRWIKILVIIVAVVVAAQSISALFGKKKSQLRIKQAGTSLRAAESYARTHGAHISSPDYEHLKATIEKSPTIRQLSIYSAPNSGTTIYDWNEKGSLPDRNNYEQFVQTSAGTWVLIKAELKE